MVDVVNVADVADVVALANVADVVDLADVVALADVADICDLPLLTVPSARRYGRRRAPLAHEGPE